MKLKIKNNKSISAVIITKDRSKYFLKAIKSVLNQSNKVNEIIVVDNGKKKPKFDFKKINYIKTSYAIGSSRARNIGIKKSKGNYCAFLDDDDVWDKNYIKSSKKYLNHNHILIGKIYSRNSKKIIKSKSKSFNKFNSSISNLFVRNPGIIGSNIIIPKKQLKIIGGFDKKLPLGQDKAIVIEALNRGLKIVRTNAKIFFNESTHGERNTNLIKYLKGKLIFYSMYKQHMSIKTKSLYQILFLKNFMYGIYNKLKVYLSN